MANQHSLAYTKRQGFSIDYGREIEEEIVHLQQAVENFPSIQQRYPSRWLAIKLLEQDDDVHKKLSDLDGGLETIQTAQISLEHLKEIFGDDSDTIMADRRYGWINGLVRESVKRTRPDQITISDRVDQFVTNQFIGVPLFLALMWVVFMFTTEVSAPYIDWIDSVINGPVTRWGEALISLFGAGGSWVESLMVDGIIAGVGGILSFVPVLIALYLALAVLEDSGYMARGAFVMDNLMHVFGLHGKSFVPLVIGFGCTVPAMYATRTLESRKDRILTGLLVPFMSCGARLPVYVLFASIFFPKNSGTVVFWLYLIGILMAIAAGILLRKYVFQGKEPSPFVMELPSYRMPTLRAIWLHTWERTSSFLKKASTAIMIASVVIWLLLSIPVTGSESFANVTPENSAFGRVSGWISPIFKPLGFGEWQMSGALVSGLSGKEVIVTTLAQTYGLELGIETDESDLNLGQDIGVILKSFITATGETIRSIPRIAGIQIDSGEVEADPTNLMKIIEQNFVSASQGHGQLAAFSFLIFVLLYTPCVVALAAEKQELGSKWMWVTVFGQAGLAWLASLIVFQGGKLLGLG
jgi:ferrous iron transport protein B